MIFIVLSIVFNAYVGIIFKYFGKWKIDAQIAIVVNYMVCILVGSLIIGSIPFSNSTFSSDWFPWSLLIGFLLILMFNVMSLGSVRIGVTLTQAANKMSLAIPVFFSIYLYHENINFVKIIGLASALIGVYFITLPSSHKGARKNNWWLLPLMFIGSGTIDAITKYIETQFIQDNQSLNYYLIHSFGAAAFLGTIFLVVQFVRRKIELNIRSVVAGIILGVPNYFSIYFLIKSLQYNELSSSAIIPINNIGILVLVTLYGFLIFNERLSRKNKIGLGLALLSILLLLSGK